MNDEPKRKPIFSGLTSEGIFTIVGSMTLGGIISDLFKGHSLKDALFDGVFEGSLMVAMVLMVKQIANWWSKRQSS